MAAAPRRPPRPLLTPRAPSSAPLPAPPPRSRPGALHSPGDRGGWGGPRGAGPFPIPLSRPWVGCSGRGGSWRRWDYHPWRGLKPLFPPHPTASQAGNCGGIIPFGGGFQPLSALRAGILLSSPPVPFSRRLPLLPRCSRRCSPVIRGRSGSGGFGGTEMRESLPAAGAEGSVPSSLRDSLWNPGFPLGSALPGFPDCCPSIPGRYQNTDKSDQFFLKPWPWTQARLRLCHTFPRLGQEFQPFTAFGCFSLPSSQKRLWESRSFPREAQSERGKFGENSGWGWEWRRG